VGLAYLVKFLVVKLIHLDLNFRFNMSIILIINYFLVIDNVFINLLRFKL
jgi:hypothetical protein